MQATLHQLRAFAYVARDGSFSAAARSLGVTQSAVTQHVAKLETIIGASLIIRTGHGVELTAAGRDFFALSDEFVRLEGAITDKVNMYARLRAGQLRVIANAPQPGLRIIERFSRTYPEVDVEFSLFDWTRAMALLDASEVDIGFVTAPRLHDDLVATELEQSCYVLYCLQDHPLATQKVVSLKDLDHDALLLPERGSLTERVVHQAFAKLGHQRGRIIKTTTFPVMKEAILQGVGVGIFLERSASVEDRLVEIPLRELPDPFKTYLVYPKSKQHQRLIRSFAALL